MCFWNSQYCSLSYSLIAGRLAFSAKPDNFNLANFSTFFFKWNLETFNIVKVESVYFAKDIFFYSFILAICFIYRLNLSLLSCLKIFKNQLYKNLFFNISNIRNYINKSLNPIRYCREFHKTICQLIPSQRLHK